jgi:methionyl-tRNA formyltransferase
LTGRRRVVVFGYGPLALAALDSLQRLRVTPAAVVVPGNRQGADVDVVTARVRAHGWPLLVQPPRRSLPAFLDILTRLDPDLLLVWSYSMLLPPELIGLAPLGAVNVHGGLLPEYRGGHVMNWAIANGEAETGATLTYLDEGIDTGPVIAERRFPIEWRDDAASVREKLMRAGQSLLETWWPRIEAGTAPRQAQNESRARYYRLRSAADGLVDWRQPSAAIYNLVRALVPPWPGAFTIFDGMTLVLRRVEVIEPSGARHAPGTVTSSDGTSIRVATGSGEVALTSVEIDGREVTPAALLRLGLAAGRRLA